MALYSHHGNCFLILAYKEVHGEERMMAELRKQMVNDEVESVKVEANEQIPKPKYYGLDALPAI